MCDLSGILVLLLFWQTSSSFLMSFTVTIFGALSGLYMSVSFVFSFFPPFPF